MDAEIIIPFTFFAFLAAVILVPVLAKERTKRSAHGLISQALARGQELDPALIARMTDDIADSAGRGRRTLGNGVILVALAMGFVAAGYVLDGFDPGGDAHRGMLVPAVIVGTVGVAFLLLAIVDYATKRRTA
jgi:hypothetical protein